jgi:hypothetical protein
MQTRNHFIPLAGWKTLEIVWTGCNRKCGSCFAGIDKRTSSGKQIYMASYSWRRFLRRKAEMNTTAPGDYLENFWLQSSLEWRENHWKEKLVCLFQESIWFRGTGCQRHSGRINNQSRIWNRPSKCYYFTIPVKKFSKKLPCISSKPHISRIKAEGCQAVRDVR